MFISMYIHTYYMSHRGIFRTIKSLVCALGASFSMIEPTINSTL